ncbi:MAG: hypothetical protein Q9M91_04725 [Candidatus Dojkabacteria bacterium]|nr:hypothetical protein [Candidatus Dojkabacteria bacterium]MDQ7021114.1 hypothetical protein [Candidatus Dojkabacteria bacterium]
MSLGENILALVTFLIILRVLLYRKLKRFLDVDKVWAEELYFSLFGEEKSKKKFFIMRVIMYIGYIAFGSALIFIYETFK